MWIVTLELRTAMVQQEKTSYETDHSNSARITV